MAEQAKPSKAPVHRFLVTRLTLMMALQYGVLGLWAVTVNTYIVQNTGDAGRQIFTAGFLGLAATAGAFGAMFSPIVLGVVADRYFSTEKLLAGLHLICAVCLGVMCASTTQSPFYFALLIYFQAYVPTVTLTNSLAMRHLPDEERLFPIVRAWGTGGWVIAGVFVGFAWPWATGASIEATLTPLYIAMVAQFGMSIYCLTLPLTPALGKAKVGWQSLSGGRALWSNRSFLFFLAISALVAAPTQFYNSFANPFLNQTGFEHAAAKLTMGQVMEMLAMLVLPMLMLRFGLKKLFLLGAIAWAARFAMFAFCYEGYQWLAYPAILVHGACFTFVYLTGQLYADKLADRDARGAAQGLHILVTSGLGHLGGAMMARWAQAKYLTPEGVNPPPYDWWHFWMAPAAVSAFAALAFGAALLFTNSRSTRQNSTSG